MKKLEMNQMLTIDGGGKNRDCMIVGGLTVVATALGGWLGLVGGAMTAASMGCFS